MTLGRHRASEGNFDVVCIGVGVGHERIFAGFCAAHDLKGEGFAGHGVEDGLVAGGAAFADRIVEKCGAGRCCGDFIINLKTSGFRGEQLVAGVLVGFGLLGRGRRGQSRLRLLCAQRQANEEGKG